jgi:excisionase family DNA binding protein
MDWAKETIMAVRDRTILPPEDDTEFRRIVAQLTAEPVPELVMPDGTRIALPVEVATLLRDVVLAMAEGKAVTVAPHHTTLTTQEAADLLGVSRPTLVKLLNAGELPYSTPGRHRRLRLSDVLAYRDRIRHERDLRLDELADLSADAGLYDDDVTRTRLRR